MSKEKINSAAEVWAMVMREIPYDLAEVATAKVLAQRTIPTMPAVGEIMQAALDITHIGEPSALECWALVSEGFSKYGRYQEKAFLASLPPRAAKVVRSMGWEELCDTPTDATSVIRGQFIKLYNGDIERDRDLAALPESIRRQLTGQRALRQTNEEG